MRLTSRRTLLSLLVVLAAALGLLASRAAAEEAGRLAPVADALAAGDPLAFDAGRLAELERTAAAGHSHVLYARSPGGIVETARRTARWRPEIERAVAGSGFSADVLEGIVLLESAGRADAIAGDGPLVASGLVQIMGGTANDFLDLGVNLDASGILTRKIAAAYARGDRTAARRLEARRRQVDARFAPRKALAAAVRYLTKAREYLGRNDLAVASYHMGIGNLQNVVEAYAGAAGAAVPYAQLYFDSAPDRNAAAWRILSGLSDDSLHYFFKVLAAKRVMHLYRSKPGELAALSVLHARKRSAEEVLHPAWRTRVFQKPAEIARARAAGKLHFLPNQPATHRFQVSPFLGQQARGLGTGPGLYRALRPESLATLAYMAQRVHELSGSKRPLVVTSAVRDWRYQSRLMASNAMAARSYSIHTTGYAFDLARAWSSRQHAAAVQFVLDRLVSLGLIAYIKEPHAVHVAVSKRANVLVPAMLGEAGSPAGAGIGEVVVEELVDPPRARTRPAAPAVTTRADEPEAERPGFFERLRETFGLGF